MKILTFAGSLRKDSLNKKVSKCVLSYVQAKKWGEIEFLDLQGLSIPIYDGDIELATGLPNGVQKLCAKIQEADALIISSPEYNGSISGVLKNVLDWVSRQKPEPPIKGKPVLLLGASPGALGAVRGLWHTRVPFEVLGCHVYPEMMGLPKAHEAFNEDGKIKDEKTRQRFEKLLKDFIELWK